MLARTALCLCLCLAIAAVTMLRQFARPGISRLRAARTSSMIAPLLSSTNRLLPPLLLLLSPLVRGSNTSALVRSPWGHLAPGPTAPNRLLQGIEEHATAPWLPAVDAGRWGWVIYRTAYDGDDADAKFARLLEALHEMARERLEDYGRPDLIPMMDFPVVDDRAALESATSFEVRERCLRWRSDRGLPLPNPLAHAHWYSPNPRYDFCLMVDRRALDSLDHMSLETTTYNDCLHMSPRRQEVLVPLPFIAVVELKWASEEQKYGGPLDEEDIFEPIEGSMEEDLGWYYLPLKALVEEYDDIQRLLRSQPYARPPEIQDRDNEFERDREEPWKGDEAEGHTRGAQYDVNRWIKERQERDARYK